jgi:thiamine kinase-like enzyme
VAPPTRSDGTETASGSLDLPPEVAARLDAVPLFAGRRLQVEELSGGLTNRNYKITVDGARYVARMSSPQGALLAIDRGLEYAASVAASASGVAPGVAAYAPLAGVLVIEWLDARTFTEADVRDGGNLQAIVAALRVLHAGPPLPGDFDCFDLMRGYLDVVSRRGLRMPDRFGEFLPTIERIQAALAVRDVGRVPCHNDLLAANLLHDGSRVRLIDYEYAGNNDACFELGNLWSESNLAPEQLEELVGLYYGQALRHKVARARLFGLVAKSLWMLWASIQAGVSDLDFDFWSWGMEKYDRAVAEFDGPDLARWIDEAQRED